MFHKFLQSFSQQTEHQWNIRSWNYLLFFLSSKTSLMWIQMFWESQTEINVKLGKRKYRIAHDDIDRHVLCKDAVRLFILLLFFSFHSMSHLISQCLSQIKNLNSFSGVNLLICWKFQRTKDMENASEQALTSPNNKIDTWNCYENDWN